MPAIWPAERPLRLAAAALEGLDDGDVVEVADGNSGGREVREGRVTPEHRVTLEL